MKKQFTDGQWFYEKNLLSGNEAGFYIRSKMHKEWTKLASISCAKLISSSEKESEANAKLIASAPKLLEELIYLVENIEKYLSDERRFNLPNLEYAKNAIEEATK